LRSTRRLAQRKSTERPRFEGAGVDEETARRPDLASDDDATLAVVAKLVDALSRAIPTSHDLELKKEALRLGRELLRGTKYDEQTR
jgi:hypothetical protein